MRGGHDIIIVSVIIIIVDVIVIMIVSNGVLHERRVVEGM